MRRLQGSRLSINEALAVIGMVVVVATTMLLGLKNNEYEYGNVSSDAAMTMLWSVWTDAERIAVCDNWQASPTAAYLTFRSLFEDTRAVSLRDYNYWMGEQCEAV